MNAHNLTLNSQRGKPFNGVFRITGRVAHFDELGEPYVRLRLSCSQGDRVGVVWLNRTELPDTIGHLSLVSVHGELRSQSDPWVRIDQIDMADRDTLTAIDVLRSLPRSYCPQPGSFDELVRSVNALNSEHLKTFIRLVLERRDRIEPFLRFPASERYHHNHPGGLLVHSLEVANNVVQMIELNEPTMPLLQKETGFVAGLLHDIGKIYSFDALGRRSTQSQLVEHDALTLELCAAGLAWLDRHDNQTAITLRHLWTCASPGARYGYQPMMTLARYLRDADGQSAMADNQRQAFRYSSKRGFRRQGQNRYWQPETDHLLPMDKSNDL
ncbi:MAG: TraI domain-containing protein [Motiliproteus sp.]|nr:TraI domain-containing protein [Motiliproteus sp.]MCW9052577.1 TraI domain-containing protein [Motiliproteus sp.]